MVVNVPSTRSLPAGSTYRGSSLTSLHLQAKGSEYSFATRRRAPERKSPNKRRDVGVRNSSSGPCVLSLSIEPKCDLLTKHFRATAKVIQDRKSTRLNSSHLVISYAVFCLKKKKITSLIEASQHVLC